MRTLKTFDRPTLLTALALALALALPGACKDDDKGAAEDDGGGVAGDVAGGPLAGGDLGDLGDGAA